MGQRGHVNGTELRGWCVKAGLGRRPRKWDRSREGGFIKGSPYGGKGGKINL